MNSRLLDKYSSKLLFIILAIVLCVFSISIRPVLSKVDTYSHVIEQLDKKRNNVTALVAASSVTSALISAIPDDTATPIANQLAEFSKGFIVIAAVLFAEKYLLTTFGSISSLMLLISGISMIVYNLGYNRKWLYNTIIKLLILAVAIGTVIPFSIRVTDKIEETFKESIDEIVNDALESEEELKTDEDTEIEDKNLWQKFIGLFSYVGDKVSDAVTSAGRLIEKAKNALGYYVEAIAVMFVTSCIIPAVVLILYIIVIKYVFALNFSVSALARRTFHIEHNRCRKNHRQ